MTPGDMSDEDLHLTIVQPDGMNKVSNRSVLVDWQVLESAAVAAGQDLVAKRAAAAAALPPRYSGDTVIQVAGRNEVIMTAFHFKHCSRRFRQRYFNTMCHPPNHNQPASASASSTLGKQTKRTGSNTTFFLLYAWWIRCRT